jgi:hypothetical protein
MFAWIKRNNAARPVRLCRRKFEEIDVERFVKAMSPRVVVVRSTRADEPVVWTKDLDWVDAWATFYGMEIPHHSSFMHK